MSDLYTENYRPLKKLKKTQINKKIFHGHGFKEVMLLKCHTTQIYLQIQYNTLQQKEGAPALCNSMDGRGEHYAK